MSSTNPYRPIWVIALVAIAVIVVVGIVRQRNASGGGAAGLIPWQSDFAAASELSAKSGKPMLVYITADWCSYCKKLDGEAWSNARIATAVNDGYIPVKVDGDRQPEVARQFSAQGFPWVVAVPPGKPAVAVAEGYVPPDYMLERLTAISSTTNASAVTR
jgi:thioredoxin-like negative regulator of GroEL